MHPTHPSQNPRQAENHRTQHVHLRKMAYCLQQRSIAALKVTLGVSSIIPLAAITALIGGTPVIASPVLAANYTRNVIRTGGLSISKVLGSSKSSEAFVAYVEEALKYSRHALEAKTLQYYTRFSDKHLQTMQYWVPRLSTENVITLYAYNRYLERGGRLNLEGAGTEELCRKRDKYNRYAMDRDTRQKENYRPSRMIMRTRLTDLTEAMRLHPGMRIRYHHYKSQTPSPKGPIFDTL